MPATVPGKARIDDAKITGMTPPVLTLSGMCVLGRRHPALADEALGVLDGDAPVPALDEDDGRNDPDHHRTMQDHQPEQANLAGPQLVQRLEHRARQPETMPAKMMSDIPLPMPRSVICSPSHITKTLPVVIVSMVISRKSQPRVDDDRQAAQRVRLRLERVGVGRRLHEAQQIVP